MAIIDNLQRLKARGIATLCLAVLATPTLAADITLEIINIESAEGQLRIAIYDSESNFKERLHYRVINQPAAVGNIEIVLSDMPNGEYGVMLFQDVNGNEKLDRNLLGIPKEPWSGSLLGRGVFGPPGWSDINFQLPTDGNSIVIDMQS